MAKKTLASPFVPAEEQPYAIPENWCWVRIGNLASLHRGVSYKKDDAHTIREKDDCLIMRGGNIGEGYIATDTDNVYVNKSLVDESQLVRKNDIIIVASTGSTKVIGRAGISAMDYEDVSFGAFLMLVRPVDQSNAKYLDFFFQGNDYRNQIRNLASGVNINNIKGNYITSMPIPVPPLAEQQRIVDRIESLFSKLDEAKEKAQAIVDGFELRKSAILHKAFTGELTLKWREKHRVGMESWEYLKIGTFAEVKGGKRLPKGHVLVAEKTEHPYLRIADFGESSIDIADLHYITNNTFEQISKYIIRKEDVYLSIVGSIGKAGIIPDELDGANLTENAARIISSRTIPMFLCRVLSAPIVQEDIKKRIRSATLGKLSLLNIKDMTVPLPSIEEQKEIVRILESLFTKEQQAKSAAEAVLDQINTMKKAILARAFRGELGTNDPAEESAAAVLI